MKSVSRREFLKGAAASLAVATVGGMLAGCAKEEKAEIQTNTEPSTQPQTKGLTSQDELRRVYFESRKAEIGEIENKEVFDIVVIGAGNGGLVAAASAVDLGASAIVIEKTASYTTWAGEIGAINSKVEYEKYGISYSEKEKQEIANDICRYASYGNDQQLVNLYVNNSGRTMDWMTEQLDKKNIEFMVETDMKDTIYKNVPHQHCAFIKGTYTELGPNQLGSQIANPAWIELIEEKGGEVRYNTEAISLVTSEEGNVTGVIVKNKDGSFTQIDANKGVVISTGGFSGNAEMMDVMGVQDHKFAANDMGSIGRNGDGITMCYNVGADIDSDAAGGIMVFDRGAVALDHHVGPEYGSSISDVWWPGSQPWLKVNTRGERFCNEDGPYDFECHAIINQPNGYAYQIFDSNYWSDVNSFHTTICSRVVAYPGSQNSEVLPGIYPVTNEADFKKVFMDPCLQSGRLIEAETLEELADKLGIENEAKETFLKTVERYNELADQGEDLDFGKMPSRLQPLHKAPYYGIAMSSWILCSLAGVKVNTNLQAIRKDGTAIEGLYVVGNDMGGFFKHTYPQFYAGLAQGKTSCFARLCTLHAITGSIYEG